MSETGQRSYEGKEATGKNEFTIDTSRGLSNRVRDINQDGGHGRRCRRSHGTDRRDPNRSQG